MWKEIDQSLKHAIYKYIRHKTGIEKEVEYSVLKQTGVE